MKYQRPEIFRIGRLEEHTFGGNKNASQDGKDTYQRWHTDPRPDVKASFRQACEEAAANVR